MQRDIYLSSGRTIAHKRLDNGSWLATPTTGPDEMTESEWQEYAATCAACSKQALSKQARLDARHNRLTRYEIVAENGNGHRLLVGYSTQPSRSGILRVVRAIGQRVIARLAISEQHVCRWTGKGRFGHRWELGNGWTIRLTGRTERDAIKEGELQPI